MYVALAVIIAAIISLAIGFSVEQAYGQSNMTAATNMTTTSSNMMATEDDNTTTGSISGLKQKKQLRDIEKYYD